MANTPEHDSVDPPGTAVPHEVEQPHAHFETPADVAADPALSKDKKMQALETMEQDARQMAVAAAEGMGGGERDALDDVLAAKQALEQPPFELALVVVTQTLRSRLSQAPDRHTHDILSGAIAALESACGAIAAAGPERPHAGR